MPVDILKEITQNRFLLILLEEKEYVSKLLEIIKSVQKTKTKVCYVCLSKPYADVVEDLKEQGIDTGNFFFIDTLSSYYGKPMPSENCIFVTKPNDLAGISIAVRKAVERNQCIVILFDTISTLLIYEESFPIVKFTHSLLSEEEKTGTTKLFIVLKGDSVSKEESQRLVKDLAMFADKTLEFEE
jgi:hypothetical protein